MILGGDLARAGRLGRRVQVRVGSPLHQAGCGRVPGWTPNGERSKEPARLQSARILRSTIILDALTLPWDSPPAQRTLVMRRMMCWSSRQVGRQPAGRVPETVTQPKRARGDLPPVHHHSRHMLRRQGTGQRGQELAELGIAVVLLMIVALGLLQFGHAWMVLNMITHAARDGARLAASWVDRGACEQINNDTQIKQAVNHRIATVTAETFDVQVSQNPPVTSASPPCAPPGTTPTVTVTVDGCVTYPFNILKFSSGGCASGFKVHRTVSFADEFR